MILLVHSKLHQDRAWKYQWVDKVLTRHLFLFYLYAFMSMIQFSVTITPKEKFDILDALLAGKKLENGRDAIADDIRLRFDGPHLLSTDTVTPLYFAVEVGKDFVIAAAAGLICNYFYERLKDRLSKVEIKIGEKTVKLSRNELEKTILEELERLSKQSSTK